jgi:AraC-like DNA-binding protein
MPVRPEAVEWGSYVVNAGFTEVKPGSPYPPYQHPSDHHFTWEKGRTLSKYQIFYVAKGSGVFESEKSGKCVVNAGDAIILFPGIWHRYKPNAGTGWTEYWLEFSGDYINRLMKRRLFRPEKPVLRIGYDPGLVQIYENIFELIRREPPDYQFLLGAKAVYFVAHLVSSQKRGRMAGRPIEEIVAEAKTILLESDSGSLNLSQIADSLNLSPSSFRRLFKIYTGFSPRQFALHAMVMKAKGLLKNTHMAIGMVSEESGFHSVYYFSRIFHKKTGLSPAAYRKQASR